MAARADAADALGWPAMTSPEAPEHAESAGAVYAALVLSELADEWDRKKSIEQRGLAVIQTSGVLVGLLFGFASVDASSRHGQPPIVVVIALIVALLLFVAAGGFAISTNWIRRYEAITVAELKRLTTPDLWGGDAAIASRRVTEARLEVLGRAREQNDQKAQDLRWAMGSEMVAVFAAGLAMLLLVESG